MKRFSKITTTQLARICGVSQGTVDRALHNRDGINPQTKEHILKVAREYDYSPSVQCGNKNNSMLIGVVLFDLYNEFFSKLAMSIVNAARRFGYSVIFQFSEKSEKNERAALEYFDYIGVDGIILFSTGSDNVEYKNYLRSIKKPLVTIGNRMFDFPFVGIDESCAMCDLAMSIAKDSPCGDILYFAPILKKDLHSQNAQILRLGGFVQAMEAMEKQYRIVTDVNDVRDFGGIICSTDYYVLNVLKHLGYREDISIGGFDNISALKNLPVRVMSVEYSTDQIANECINYILGRRFEPKIPHKLVFNTN